MRKLTFIILFLLAPPIWAESFFFSPSLFYMTDTDEGTNNVPVEETYNFMDFRIGYFLPSGLYLGGIYATDTHEAGDSEYDRTSFGPSVGYYKDNFHLIFHYFISSEQSRPGDLTLTEGSGIQFDVAYLFQFSGPFHLGPQLTYKQFNYKKYESGGAEVSASTMTHKLFHPSLVLALIF